LLSLTAAVALRSLQLEASFEDLYGADSQVVRWARTVAERLRLPDTLEIAAEPPAALKETPQALAVTERLEGRLQGIAGLGRARSIVDPLRRLNAMLHHDELRLNVGAEADERTASLLRLMRSQDEDFTALFLHRPSGAMRISVEAHKLPQSDLRRMLAEARVAVEAELPVGWSSVITGPVSVVGEMLEGIRSTQLNSFVLAAAIIFAMVAVFFRTVTDTVLSAVPTLVPVLLTLGTMGAVGLALDVGSAMVATVVVGIAVDDAIHMLAAYRRERRRGHEPPEACVAAVRHAGRALTTTSVALTLGFFTLLLSPWKSIASFGLICGIAIGSAWAATLVVLPALLARGATGGRFARRARGLTGVQSDRSGARSR
jgi:predicted RND superfamily exporter protein